MATAKTATPESVVGDINNLSLQSDRPSFAAQLQGPGSSALHQELSRLSRASTRFEGIGKEEDDDLRSAPLAVRDPQAQLLTVRWRLSNLRDEADPKFIQHLLSSEHADSDPHLVAIGYELEALLSIYPSALKLSVTSRPSSLLLSSSPSDATIPPTTLANKHASTSWDDAVFDASIWTPGERIRYEMVIPVWEEGEVLDGITPEEMPSEIPHMRVLVSLPPTYPSSSPPQLQLLGRYMGSFGIDAGLFGDITRTFITSSAVPFTPGDVCVFEGLTYAQGIVRKWYTERLSEGAEGERTREVDRQRGRDGRAMGDFPTSPSRPFHRTGETDLAFPPTTNDSLQVPSSAPVSQPRRPSPRPTFSYTRDPLAPRASGGSSTPAAVHEAEAGHFPHFVIHVSAPVVDRKSTFIGHAIRVTDEREVPLVIHEILSDKKVAKAAHPAMFAYRITKDVGGVAGKIIQTDCDDDGESAAGSRIAHLLEILEVENVLVVVSRWYGGILLGADRFKHINQAARDALEIGGFLAEKEGKESREPKGRRK